MADLKSLCKEITLDANPNEHSDYGFGKQMNWRQRKRRECGDLARVSRCFH